MKKVLRHTLSILIVLIFICLSNSSYSQPPPPPTSEGGSGTGGTSGERTGAPIGGGLFILLGLGVAYAGKKLYDLRKEK